MPKETHRRTSITEKEQKELFRKYRKEGKNIFWGHIGCALWKPKFEVKFKVGDVVQFFVGKTRITPNGQKLEWIRLAGIGRIFGFYDDGYYIKPMRYFIKDERSGKQPLGLHHNWVHNAPFIFNKFKDEIMMWSVS